jgi:hypothetical protein
MNNKLSSNLVGCGTLLIVLAIIGGIFGSGGSRRWVFFVFNVMAEELGSPLYAALALGAAGVAIILIALSIELLSEPEEPQPPAK